MKALVWAILIQLGLLAFVGAAGADERPPLIDPLQPPPGALPAIVDKSRPHDLHYPSSAAQGREQGKVVLLLTIDDKGTVLDASVRQTSVHASLDRAAVASVSAWHFLPATINGHPVASRRYLTVTFEMR